ncbi:MAG: hypothetical protein ACM3JD_06075, partial [Rudaea sp.]
MALLTRAKEIIAYEPVPDIFQQLLKNCEPYSQISCLNRALGSTVGETVINVHQRHELSSILPIG